MNSTLRTYIWPIGITLLIGVIILVCNIFDIPVKTITKEEYDNLKSQMKDLSNNGSITPQKSQNFVIINNKVIPLTKLTPEELEVQKTKGCEGCHNY